MKKIEIEKYTLDTITSSPYTALLINQNIPKHNHFFWEITYSVNGTLLNYVNENVVECHSLSKIIIIKPGDTHEIVKIDNSASLTPEQHRDIYVHIDKMKDVCNLLDKNLYATLCDSPSIVIDTVNENLEALEQTLNFFNVYEPYFSSHMELFDQLHTSIVCQILGIYIKKQLSSKTLYPKWIEDFFDNLKSEDFLRKDIDEIIQGIYYSHGYICREFKKHVGKTMVQCLNESRIVYSTILLMNNSKSILDIAMLLNYNSQSAYINAFKKVYYVSPNAYRKQMIK